MLKDDVDMFYNYLTQNYCTDQMFNWAFNQTKQVLINQGNPNAEPSRTYMIVLIIKRIFNDVYALISSNKEFAEEIYIKNFNISDLQVQQIRNIANKADGTSAQVGGGVAGAGAGYMFGGLLGAAIGGFFGALAGNKYNNQNRQKITKG